jgi:hypothetical protein
MDPKLSVYHETASIDPDDEFLLQEGLELLANYRAIASEAHRQAVRDLVVSLASGDDGIVPN